MEYLKEVWLPTRFILRYAFNHRFEVDPMGLIIEIDNAKSGWRDDLFDAEAEEFPDCPEAYQRTSQRPVCAIMASRKGWIVAALQIERAGPFSYTR